MNIQNPYNRDMTEVEAALFMATCTIGTGEPDIFDQSLKDFMEERFLLAFDLMLWH